MPTKVTKKERRSRLPPVPESYFILVREFPLLRINDDDHLDEALQVIDRLIRRPIDSGEQAYLDTLSELVIVYESQSSKSNRPDYPAPASAIGIGGSLAASPLPHHRTYGSVSGDSVG
jgi:hypothetical protein